MENASKALIIAGAILLSILIIALGIYVFNMAKSATSDNALSDVEKQQFNGPFQEYEGSKMGSLVINLIDKLVSNMNQNKDADDRLPDIVYYDTRTSFNAADFGVDDAVTEEMKKRDDEVGIETDPSGCIVSDSASLGNEKIGKLRTKIANRHYYKVSMTISPDSGLIDYIFIQY